MRGAGNPDGRTAAPGLLRFANKKQRKRGKSPGVRDIWVRGLSAAVL
jgi:hypothetical protein